VQGAAAQTGTLGAHSESVSRSERPNSDLTRIRAIFRRMDAALEFFEC
jgi:hypothetical protein